MSKQGMRGTNSLSIPDIGNIILLTTISTELIQAITILEREAITLLRRCRTEIGLRMMKCIRGKENSLPRTIALLLLILSNLLRKRVRITRNCTKN